jgi:hypothetical protein
MDTWQILKNEEIPNLKFDATSVEIKLGRTYGFSTDSNGITNTTIGKIIKFNEKTVTLEIIFRQMGLWSNTPKQLESMIGKKVAVKAMKLFPVVDVVCPSEDLFDKDFLKELGFKVTKDDGIYGKAESLRPKGKILLSWNRDGTTYNYFGIPEIRKNSFFGIKEDCGTRSTFNGIVYTREQIELLIKLSC